MKAYVIDLQSQCHYTIRHRPYISNDGISILFIEFDYAILISWCT